MTREKAGRRDEEVWKDVSSTAVIIFDGGGRGMKRRRQLRPGQGEGSYRVPAQVKGERKEDKRMKRIKRGGKWQGRETGQRERREKEKGECE